MAIESVTPDFARAASGRRGAGNRAGRIEDRSPTRAGVVAGHGAGAASNDAGSITRPVE